jgi:hypothetical protein
MSKPSYKKIIKQFPVWRATKEFPIKIIKQFPIKTLSGFTVSRMPIAKPWLTTSKLSDPKVMAKGMTAVATLTQSSANDMRTWLNPGNRSRA